MRIEVRSALEIKTFNRYGQIMNKLNLPHA